MDCLRMTLPSRSVFANQTMLERDANTVGQGTLENQKLKVRANIKWFANIFIAFSQVDSVSLAPAMVILTSRTRMLARGLSIILTLH